MFHLLSNQFDHTSIQKYASKIIFYVINNNVWYSIISSAFVLKTLHKTLFLTSWWHESVCVIQNVCCYYTLEMSLVSKKNTVCFPWWIHYNKRNVVIRTKSNTAIIKNHFLIHLVGKKLNIMGLSLLTTKRNKYYWLLLFTELHLKIKIYHIKCTILLI